MNRSATRALLLFWPFQSLPRLWYLASVGMPGDANPLVYVAAPLALGFLEDGLVIALLLLPLQVLHMTGVRRALSDRLTDALGITLTTVLAALLAVFMLDVEFFRYFGFHSNWTHLSLLREWEQVSPLVSPSASPGKLALYVVAIPGGFAIACATICLDATRHLLWRPLGMVATFVVLCVGLGVSRVLALDPLLDSLARNYLVALVKASIDRENLSSPANLTAAEIHDLQPLVRRPIAEPTWHTFDPEFPLVKATGHHLCRLGIRDAVACLRDTDGDGYPLASDCHDGWAGIHPNAHDTPGDGIDSDCSGLDANPPNIILVHWEGVPSPALMQMEPRPAGR